MSLPIVRRTSTARIAALVLVGLCSMAAASRVRAAEAAVPYMDREAIENILKRKVADLANEKDKDGIPNKRGTYSKSFKKIDATSYSIAFHQDAIEPEGPDGTQQLKTQRFDLTVKQDLTGRWSLAKEELKDTYVGLHRGYSGGEWIYTFAKLQFEKEGLKVSATNGWAYGSRRQGHISGFAVFADDLRFEYAPPADTAETSHYSTLIKKLAKEHPDDLVFKPERAEIFCDEKTCGDFMTKVFTGLEKVGGKDGGDAGAAAGTQGRMLKRLKEDVDESKKNRRESPFSGFRRPDDPDNRYWEFQFKRDGVKEHYASLTYDNLEPWQMSYYVTDYGQVFAYYSEDTRNKGIDPLVLEERGDEDARDFDLVGMKGAVDLALDEPLAYSGDIVYKLKIKRELTDLPFYIARVRFPGEREAEKNPKLFINSVQDADGNELTWTRLGSFGGLVVLPKAAHANDVITLRLQFLNYDAIYSLNPFFFGLSREGWLPFVRFGDFIDEFDLTVRLPDKYQILGVGKVESDTTKDGIRTAHYTSPSPVTFPTIIYGIYLSDDAGKYKATKLDGTEIPVRVYVDKGSLAGLTDGEGAAAGARDIRAKSLQAIATQAAVALNLYKELYGVDYPFAKLDLVADPVGSFYGQSPASLIYLGFGLFRGEGAVAQMGGASITKFNKDTVAHETGHQWWGGLITNANFRNYWFVESMAEVSSAIYVERTQGKKQYLEKVEAWRKVIEDNNALNSVQNGYTTYAGEGFRAAVANIYNKGPYAFHMFRSTFGDEKFFQLLKEMAQTLAHKEIVTRDMQDVMEKVVGGNMDWFFDQWIRGVGTPQYAIFWTKRKNEQGKWIVEGSIKQRVVMGADKTELKGVYYRGVAPLTFVDSNGKEVKSARPMLVQGAETPFKLIVADEPEQVYFNKDGEILAANLLINQSW